MLSLGETSKWQAVRFDPVILAICAISLSALSRSVVIIGANQDKDRGASVECPDAGKRQ
jgi:hypothetical protein